MARVLLLAGTHEARALAGRLWDMPGIDLTASLAGVTSEPLPIAARTRRGGFGGVDGLTAYLRETETAAVIDATHPFAARMPWHAEAAAQRAGIPRLRLIRAQWPVAPGWREVASAQEAAAYLPAGAKVFLTVGRQQIEPFLDRKDCRFVLRSIETPTQLPAHVIHIAGRPGSDYASEFAILCSYRISHLVAKNSGGPARAKLDAAMGLGVRVILQSRPKQPPGPVADNIPDAVAWLRRNVGFGNRTRKP